MLHGVAALVQTLYVGGWQQWNATSPKFQDCAYELRTHRQLFNHTQADTQTTAKAL